MEKLKWIKFNSRSPRLPLKNKIVLLQIDGVGVSIPPAVVAGYLHRPSCGEPYFIAPGCMRRDINGRMIPNKITDYCDCFDGFNAPLWPGFNKLANSMKHPGVWCCEKRSKCKWQGFALHHGLGWGIIENAMPAWRDKHDKYCGGKLIQLVKPLEEL